MANVSIESIRRAAVFSATVLFVAVLYLGRELLIPLAVAILVAFLLKPVVTQLTRLKIPRGLAVLLATLMSLGIVIGLLYLLSSQIVDLTTKLPNYRQNLSAKTHSIHNMFERKVGRLNENIASIKKEMSTTTKPASSGSGLQLEVKPAAQEADTDFMSIAAAVVTPVLTQVEQVGLVFFYVLFLLLDLEIVTKRLQWLAEHLRLGVPVDVVDEAFAKVAKYLRVQLLINVSYAILTATALWFIGVPNALLWGVLAGVLRYVPFIGPWIGALLPFVLAIAIFPGWGRPFLVIGAFVGIEAITNGLLEPMLYGHTTGVSSIGVVVATFFWGWLWGPVGLILAMPITTCLVVIGRHIPLLRTISMMLSGDSIESSDAAATLDPTKPVDVTSFILKMR